jgi:Domain of unknown function (DUF4340)
MRRFLSTITLLVLALGFGAYLYFIDAKKPVTEENAKQKVFGLDASKIEQLEVKSASGDVTTLKKDTGGWTILKPIQAPGDQNNASDVASSLATLEQDRVVDENPAELKTYGLAPPRIEVTFNVTGEKAPKQLLVGDKSPTGAGLYAKTTDNKKVFLIGNSLETSLNRSTFDFRDKTALKFDATKVDSVELVSKGQTVRVVKTGEEWKLVSPLEAPADFTSVEGLIGQIQSAQMMSLKDKPEDVKDLKAYGLDKPEVTATLSSGASQVVMQLGKTAETTTFWARDPSKPAVFTIGNGLAEELRKSPTNLRRKEIFGFRPFNTSRFEITRGKETRVFERVKGTGANAADTWKQTAPAVKIVDASNFEGALLEFSNLRADSFVDKPGPTTGVNSPAATITVKFDDGKKQEQVKFGGTGPDVFAFRLDQPGAMKVEMGKFDAALKKLDSIQ